MHKTIKTLLFIEKKSRNQLLRAEMLMKKKASNNYCTVSVPVCKLLVLKWPLWRGYLNVGTHVSGCCCYGEVAIV